MSTRAAVLLALAGATACSSTQVAWYGHTPDRARVVEVLQKGSAQWLVAGARSSRRYRAIAADDLAFDTDGRRLAFAARVQDRPERWTVVTDFVEGPAWDGIGGLRFGPRGTHLVYAGLERGRWSVVVDGARGPAFEALDADAITFSPDGRRVGYVAADPGCVRAVAGGLATPCYARIVGLAVADTASADVVVAVDPQDGAVAHVLVGGARVRDVQDARALSVDPGVHHWAVAAEGTGSAAHLVVDGSEQDGTFDRIGRVVWAPDGSSLAYTARRGDKWCVVAASTPTPTPTPTSTSPQYAEVEDPLFAATGAHLGYLARDPGRSVVVIDGHVVWESDAPATALTLSDDGSRRGWIYRDGTKAVIAVDDRRYAFDVAVEQTLRFSRDGRHWAALVGSLADRRLYVAVDGQAWLPFDSEELFGDPAGGAQPRLGKWVAAELELYLARGGRS